VCSSDLLQPVKTFVLAATTAAAALLANAASAAVYISFDGTTSAFTQAGDGVFTYDADCGVVNCGGFEAVTVDGSAPPSFPGLLHSDTVTVNTASTGAADLTIWVTRTDLTNLSDAFFSSFTSNNQGGAVNVTLDTFISASNELFGGVNLASFNHNAVGSGSSNVNTVFNTNPNGTYSVTERYIIRAPASSTERSSSPTITLAGVPGAAVPEPGTWALMIIGFGGAGAMLRSRRQRISASAA
jgi:hypothetical protein